MLKALKVKNFILIDSLEIQFPAGLVIITGETGAGKSILLGAVALLTGGKADASSVGPASDTCVVEGEFDCSADSTLEAIFADLDLPWNGGDITIRRVVSTSGRSRCFICDEPVSKEDLAAISSRLIDIHSQHQTLKLSDPAFRLSVLDAFAGTSALREDCTTLWKKLSQERKTLEEVKERLSRLALEKDFNESLYQQLEDAKLQEGELASLEAEQKLLSNAEEIKLSLVKAESIMEGDGGDVPSMAGALREVNRTLTRLSSFVPAAGELAERVESAKAELDDILAEISSLEESTEVSQDRLEAVESRMSLLYSLMTKHNVRTVEELIEKRDTLSATLYNSEELEQTKDTLERVIRDLEEKISAASAQLHKDREEAAGKFAKAVTESLHGLSLEGAVFGVELETIPQTATGTDAVSFVFSATGGQGVEVGKGASGGEMSRIMLSIKDLMARYTAMPTMIFDEIDTGISGSVADAMGSMICRMGEAMQIFAITHLPQVAAKGNAHLLVSKEISEGRAVSTIKQLDKEERVQEIARMLSGAAITPEAMANAESLLRSNPACK